MRGNKRDNDRAKKEIETEKARLTALRKKLEAKEVTEESSEQKRIAYMIAMANADDSD